MKKAILMITGGLIFITAGCNNGNIQNGEHENDLIQNQNNYNEEAQSELPQQDDVQFDITIGEQDIEADVHTVCWGHCGHDYMAEEPADLAEYIESDTVYEVKDGNQVTVTMQGEQPDVLSYAVRTDNDTVEEETIEDGQFEISGSGEEVYVLYAGWYADEEEVDMGGVVIAAFEVDFSY